jgi:hypothetical protein
MVPKVPGTYLIIATMTQAEMIMVLGHIAVPWNCPRDGSKAAWDISDHSHNDPGRNGDGPGVVLTVRKLSQGWFQRGLGHI